MIEYTQNTVDTLTKYLEAQRSLIADDIKVDLIVKVWFNNDQSFTGEVDWADPSVSTISTVEMLNDLLAKELTDTITLILWNSELYGMKEKDRTMFDEAVVSGVKYITIFSKCANNANYYNIKLVKTYE